MTKGLTKISENKEYKMKKLHEYENIKIIK